MKTSFVPGHYYDGSFCQIKLLKCSSLLCFHLITLDGYNLTVLTTLLLVFLYVQVMYEEQLICNPVTRGKVLNSVLAASSLVARKLKKKSKNILTLFRNFATRWPPKMISQSRKERLIMVSLLWSVHDRMYW